MLWVAVAQRAGQRIVPCMQGPEALPEDLSGDPDDASDLLGTRVHTAPPFLRARPGASPLTGAAAEEAAEEAATAPGPLGAALEPGEWFDAVVVGHLAGAWEAHAKQVDQDVHGVATVWFLHIAHGLPVADLPGELHSSSVLILARACTGTALALAAVKRAALSAGPGCASPKRS
jgi:hypothetical protein